MPRISTNIFFMCYMAPASDAIYDNIISVLYPVYYPTIIVVNHLDM